MVLSNKRRAARAAGKRAQEVLLQKRLAQHDVETMDVSTQEPTSASASTPSTSASASTSSTSASFSTPSTSDQLIDVMEIEENNSFDSPVGPSHNISAITFLTPPEDDQEDNEFIPVKKRRLPQTSLGLEQHAQEHRTPTKEDLEELGFAVIQEETPPPLILQYVTPTNFKSTHKYVHSMTNTETHIETIGNKKSNTSKYMNKYKSSK